MQYYGGKSEMLVVILCTITKEMTDLIKLGKFKGITSFIVQFAQASAYTAISIRLPRRQIVDGHSGLVSGGNKVDNFERFDAIRLTECAHKPSSTHTCKT